MKSPGGTGVGPVRHSILFRTMLAYIVIFAIPMLILYGLLSRASSNQAVEDAGKRFSVTLRSIVSTMDEILRGGNTIQSQIQADPVFCDVSFSKTYLYDKDAYTHFRLTNTISRTLYQYYLSNSYVSAIDLYNPYSDTLFSSKLYSTRRIVAKPGEETAQALRGPEGCEARAWYPLWEDGEKLLFVSYFRPFSSNRPSSVLFGRVAIPADILMNRFRSLLPDESVGLALRLDGELCPVLGSAGIKTLTEADAPSSGSWKAYASAGERYLAVCYRSPFTGWDYLLSAPFRSFASSVAIINRYSLYFLLCLGLIFIVSLLYLLAQVIRPIHTLSRAIRVAEKGDLSVRVHLRREDELGRIGQQFNVLLASIEQLIRENYETRMLKNDFELRYIQNQLKEHFLYNTLDSIHWIANRNHVPEISEMIFNLSHFFRLTLNEGGDTITVSQAAEILHSYLTLLNVRMDNAILVQIHMDPSLAQERTYKYFFQPIVENAYQHGLRPNLGGRLTVTFEKDEREGWLRYTVDDNGVGMTEDKLSALLLDIQSLPDEPDSGEANFALKNIVRQLRLYFQNEYTFSIQSRPGEGTTVTLCFPLREGGSHASAEANHH